MHIAVFNQPFISREQGGGSRWNQFSKMWVEDGHRVTVIAGTVHYATGRVAPNLHGRFISHERNGNIEVIRAYTSEAYNKSFAGRLWAYFTFMASSLWAGLSVKSPDLVIASSPPLFVALPAYVISVIRGCPLVFEVRDIWPQSAIDLGILKSRILIKLSTWFEKFIYSRSALIVVLLEEFKEHVASCGIREDKVVYVPNGADLDLFVDPRPRSDVRRELGFSEEFLVLYMGAHGVANDLEQVLRAARLLRDDREIRFIFLGDGMEKPRLRQLAREWQLDNVKFLDSVPKEKVKDICNAVDVGLVVLRNIKLFKAAQPNKLFDYMAAGKPIITTVNGVCRQLIDSAGAGLFADPEKPEDMVECILKLSRDPTTCAEMGRSGRAFVEAHFQRERLSSFYEGCLVELVRQRGLPRSPRSATPQA